MSNQHDKEIKDKNKIPTIVHFEIPADNVERAKKFYQETFDWKITPMPQMNYTLLGTVEIDEKKHAKRTGSHKRRFDGAQFRHTRSRSHHKRRQH